MCIRDRTYTATVTLEGKNYTDTRTETLPSLGHKTQLVGAKPATCTEDGYTGDEVCTVCQEVVKKGEVIPALGHKTQLVGAKAATCTEDGYTCLLYTSGVLHHQRKLPAAPPHLHHQLRE